MHTLLERPQESEHVSVDPGTWAGPLRSGRPQGTAATARRPFLAPLLRGLLVLGLIWVGGAELAQGQALRAGLCLVTIAMVSACLVRPGRWRR
ncbi:MAG: hypothetical protein ACTHOD_05180 [Motilibacteraceae bacterium]